MASSGWHHKVATSSSSADATERWGGSSKKIPLQRTVRNIFRGPGFAVVRKNEAKGRFRDGSVFPHGFHENWIVFTFPGENLVDDRIGCLRVCPPTWRSICVQGREEWAAPKIKVESGRKVFSLRSRPSEMVKKDNWTWHTLHKQTRAGRSVRRENMTSSWHSQFIVQVFFAIYSSIVSNACVMKLKGWLENLTSSGCT